MTGTSVGTPAGGCRKSQGSEREPCSRTALSRSLAVTLPVPCARVRVRVRVRVHACVFACAQVPRIPSPILGTTTSPFFRRNCLSFLSGHVTWAATHKTPSF